MNEAHLNTFESPEFGCRLLLETAYKECQRAVPDNSIIKGQLERRVCS